MRPGFDGGGDGFHIQPELFSEVPGLVSSLGMCASNERPRSLHKLVAGVQSERRCVRLRAGFVAGSCRERRLTYLRCRRGRASLWFVQRSRSMIYAA